MKELFTKVFGLLSKQTTFNRYAASRTSSTMSDNNNVHIVLLGDSIFDNATYVGRSGKSVIQHLQDKIPANWKATLCAIDGDVVKGVHKQIPSIPKDATHLFLSIGGNNALGFQSIIYSQVSSVGEALMHLEGVNYDCLEANIVAMQAKFQQEYHTLLSQLVALNLPLTVCNVYNPNYPPNELKVAKTGLCILNDVILSEAAHYKVPMIDIKSLFNSKEDYANPIEPSTKGGDKLSDVILKVVNDHNFQIKVTSVYLYTNSFKSGTFFFCIRKAGCKQSFFRYPINFGRNISALRTLNSAT